MTLNTNKPLFPVVPKFPAHWLELFQTEFDPQDWDYISRRFYPALAEAYGKHAARGKGLLAIKRDLAAGGMGAVDVSMERGGLGRAPEVQKTIQFLCGYADLDLRDAAHVGHGWAVLQYASPHAHKLFDERICSGELVAICASEERGGTDINHFDTTAERSAGRWKLRGEKCHISRVEEATLLTVFFRIPEFSTDRHQAMGAVVIDAGSPGIERWLIEPSGLRGWSWGGLKFHDVPLEEHNFLGEADKGRRVFDSHFAYYRPMVAAAALGAAARIYDEALADLQLRKDRKLIERSLDTTRELFGQARYEIESQLHYVLRMHRFGESGTRALLAKACAIDRALEIGERLERTMGARSFHDESPVAKAMRDLRGYRFADGAHDALLRFAGKHFLSF